MPAFALKGDVPHVLYFSIADINKNLDESWSIYLKPHYNY